MFATLFQTFLKETDVDVKKYEVDSKSVGITKQQVEDMLAKLDETPDGDAQSVSSNNAGALESLSIAVTQEDNAYDAGSLGHFDDTKSEVSSVGENKQNSVKIADSSLQKTINQINSLQCPFTWNLKANKRKNLISLIENKYGEYNLDISSAEFTLERYLLNWNNLFWIPI